MNWPRDGILRCMVGAMLAFVCGCSSTVDGSHADTVDAGSPPCAAPMMTCGTVAAPRPIAPLSTATTTSQQPTLHWQLAAGTDGAIVEICRDRPCTIVEQTIAAPGSSVEDATSLLAPGVHFWRLFGRIGTTMGTVAGPTWEFFVGYRSAPVDTSWGSVLDVNGDGYADVAVADQSGTAYLYLGSSSGPGTTPSVWPGDINGVVANAGDVNGDGYADLLVGAHLYFGSLNGLGTVATALTGIDPMEPIDGQNISGVGDVNGDGYADLATGSMDDDRAPMVIIPGSASGVGTPIALASPPAEAIPRGLASNIVSAGDINGDSYADVVWGTYLYLGSASGLSATPAVLSGTDGYAAGAGDVNGDGYADVVADNLSDSDTFLFYAGSASGLGGPIAVATPQATWEGFVTEFASGGDFNGDGYADVVEGFDVEVAGVVYVYLGSATGLANPVMLTGSGVMGDRFGRAVAGAGDVNDDGYADVVAGDPAAGVAHVYLGSAVGLDAIDVVLTGPAGFQNFGLSVALGW